LQIARLPPEVSEVAQVSGVATPDEARTLLVKVDGAMGLLNEVIIIICKL
jgi:hypothetical protein